MGYRIWLLIVFLLLMHVLAGIAGIEFGTNIPLGIATFFSGLVVFFWLLGWARLQSEPMDRDGILRAAIAGAIVMQYLSMVGTVAYFGRGPQTPLDLPLITQTLVSSFTTIVGVVIAFFFGASAYIEAQKSKTRTKSKPDNQGKNDPA